MPFTGTGTGIQNANDVFFSGLAQSNVLRYDNTTGAIGKNVVLMLSHSDYTNTIQRAFFDVLSASPCGA